MEELNNIISIYNKIYGTTIVPVYSYKSATTFSPMVLVHTINIYNEQREIIKTFEKVSNEDKQQCFNVLKNEVIEYLLRNGRE